MEILLWIGSFLLWSVIHIITTAIFAIPAGFGLAAGFYCFKQWINDRYVKNLEADTLAGGAVTEI